MEITKKLLRVLTAVENFVFPELCVCCGNACDTVICPRCKAQVELSGGVCVKSEELYEYGTVRFYGKYAGRLKDAIVRYKFYGEMWMGKPFGRLLFETYGKSITPENYDFITYVPVSESGFRRRGFDQCLEMAGELSRCSGVPLLKLLECSDTKKIQSSLDRFGRDRNIKGKFCIREAFEEEISGKRVLLIDDILTTGATLRSCGKLITEAGAATVDCMVFATGRTDL